MSEIKKLDNDILQIIIEQVCLPGDLLDTTITYVFNYTITPYLTFKFKGPLLMTLCYSISSVQKKLP